MNSLQFLNTIPFGTKALIFVNAAIALLGTLIDFQFIGFSPYSLERIQIWRLPLSLLYQGTFFQFLITLIAVQDLSKIEKKIGSVLFLYEAILKNIQGMLLVYSFYRFLNLMFVMNLESLHYGIWHILIYWLFFRQQQSMQEETQIFCLPLVIKSGYYSLVFLIVLSIYDPVCLIFAQMGLFEYFVFKKVLFRLPKNMIDRIEKMAWLAKYSCRPDFILVDHAQELVKGTQIEFQIEQFPEALPNSGNKLSEKDFQQEDDSLQIKQ